MRTGITRCMTVHYGTVSISTDKTAGRTILITSSGIPRCITVLDGAKTI